MDADFSIRNEVDSIRSPHADDFDYSHQSSPYDDIVSKINSAPPFPSAPLNQSFHPNPYLILLSQQLEQQQRINAKLIEKLTKEEPISWKYLAITLGSVLLFFLLQNSPFSRKNPRVVYVDNNNNY